jgi:F-type H+-transporting ATPase subunit 8
MPQLIPFFFVNQVLFNFALLTIIIYIFTKYLLPRFVRLFKARLHINNIYNITDCIKQHSFNHAPKAHAFIKTAFKSSMVYATAAAATATATATVGLMAMIMRNSVFLFTAGYFLNTAYQTTGLLTPVIISIMGHIAQNTVEIYTWTSGEFFGTGLSMERLHEIHAYLTPYLRSYHSLFRMLHNIVRFFVGTDSPDLIPLQDLYARFLGAGRALLSIYREIEVLLGISLQDSPISTEAWGF